MFAIDHLGIAVKSLATSKAFYERLGRIELLEPTSDDSPIAKFLAKRGEGLHHVALHVADLPHVVEQLKSSGVRLINDQVQTGAGGHSYVFVHPSSAGGVLLELCEEQPKGV